MPHYKKAICLMLSLALSACQQDKEVETISDATMAEMSDVSTLSDQGITDMIVSDQMMGDLEDMETSGTIVAPMIEFCNSEGLLSRPWRTDQGEAIFGQIAGDFSVETLRGAWTLSEQWSGCEAYVFFVYFPDLRANPSGPWIGDQLWESDVTDLLNGPANTHYFFLSFEEESQARQNRMVEMNNRFIRTLNPGEVLPERRLHFVTDRATEVEGSVGEFLSSYLDFVFDSNSLVDLGDRGSAQAPLPFVFGIDRLQRWDSGGSLDEVVGRPMKWSMATYLGPFYNYISDTYERASQDSATELSLVSGRTSDRVHIKTIELPQPLEGNEFTSLELDVSVTCPHRNVFACSEWDRIARVSYCLDPLCEESREMARWITPYWRRGERRWIWDASHSLPWLSSESQASFRIEFGPSWERATERDVEVKLRFHQGAAELELVESLYAFGGGAFDEAYNSREPFSFTPPQDAEKVELVILLSGHGQTSQDNCAEWCDHRHLFTINNQALPIISHEGEIGSLDGCASLASRGVSPGQYGNWAPERAFWCPGLPVDPIRIDMTEFVTLGVPNLLNYQAVLGEETEPRGGEIALSVFVLSYR